MVTIEICNSLLTTHKLLEKGQITVNQVKAYAETWLVNVRGWTPGQRAHLVALVHNEITQPVAMATLNMLAAEITYQHAKHVWETVRTW